MSSLQIIKLGLHLNGDGRKSSAEDNQPPVRTPAPEDAVAVKAKRFVGPVTLAVPPSEIP